MSIMKCTTCGDVIDSREALHCSACGNTMCPNCADSSSGVCHHCFDDLHYFH